MKKELQKFSGESIRGRLRKVEISESYSDLVAESLGTSVFGQEEACRAVARIITIFEAGLSDPSRPAGVVMFLGPTGTGKSEMGEATALQLFGDDWRSHYKKVDCSDYSESHTISRFIGAPPSYVGYGDETVFDNDFLDQKNVIVFDEIEKANVALWRLLLAVFETGVMHARTGIGDSDTMEDELNFSKSLIILTSNVGAQQMQESQRASLGFLGNKKNPNVEGAAMKGLKTHFAEIPEFLGRVDEFVVFKTLDKETYVKIYWKFVQEVSDLMANVGVYFTTTVELAEHLVEKAVKDGEYGARDIRHVLHKELVLTLADLVTSNSGAKGLVADIEGGKVVFYDLTPEMEKEGIEVPLPVKKDDFNDSDDDIRMQEVLNEFDISKATEDGYGWVMEDEVVGEVMTKLLFSGDYNSWKSQADKILLIGDEEKRKTKKVLGDAFRLLEDDALRESFPEEWKVFKMVLENFGVMVF